MTEPHHMPELGPDSGQVADAAADNWVDRHAPRRWRPFLRLSRADRPIGSWLLFIPCLWGLSLAMLHGPALAGSSPLWHGVWIVLGCAIGAVLMRGAGCTWNDITDQDIDAQVRRTRSRPLPSGQVSPKAALVWIAAQCGVSALILFSFPWLAIGLGLVSLLPVAVYPFAKRFTWWPQLFLGLAINWGALLAFAAWGGALHGAAVLAYLAGIAWTLFYDTIYAHQDREDDALIGVKSTARLFGPHSKAWLLGFGLAAVVLLGAALLSLASPVQTLIALPGLAGFAAHLAWQWWRLDINDPDLCLRLFRANRNAGLLPVPFLAIAALM